MSEAPDVTLLKEKPPTGCYLCDESEGNFVCRHCYESSLDDWAFMANIACGFAFDLGASTNNKETR